MFRQNFNDSWTNLEVFFAFHERGRTKPAWKREKSKLFACIVSRERKEKDGTDAFIRSDVVRSWFNCHRKVVLNFTLSRSREFRGRYCHEMTEAPLLSEEARISPMIEEKRSTRDTYGVGNQREGAKIVEK